MTAEVPSPPDLIDPLSEAEYTARYAGALRLAGPVPDVATMPAGGARITAVDPDSPSAAASLHVNDVIVAIDGKPTPTSDAAIASHRSATAAQTLEIIPADGQAHRFVKVDRGRLGIQVGDVWLLEGLYLHNLPAGVAPVDEVRVAARCAQSDPELAESALAHAKIIGGPGTQGPAVDAIAAVALYTDDWFEKALAYAISASKTLPQNCRDQMKPIIFDSAIATFRFPLARAIAKGDDRYNDPLGAVLPAIDAFQQGRHKVAEPNPTAAVISFTDHTQNATNFAPHANSEFESTTYALWYMAHNRALPFSTADGYYTRCICGPAATDFKFSARCHFAATDNGNSGYVKVVRVGACDNGSPVIQLELFLDGYADVTAAATDESYTAVVRLNLTRLITGNRQFMLEMAIVGDRYEYMIDGRRVFYGPMPASPAVDTRKLNLMIQTVGVTGEFSQVNWRTAAARAGNR
ncbi:MAG: hypothetical protein ABSC42_01170 [Tepidisphaeraceae bacterium]